MLTTAKILGAWTIAAKEGQAVPMVPKDIRTERATTDPRASSFWRKAFCEHNLRFDEMTTGLTTSTGVQNLRQACISTRKPQGM